MLQLGWTLKGIMLSELFHLYKISRIGKSRDRKQVVSCQRLEEGENGKWPLMGTRFLLGWWYSLRTREVVIVQHCECTKCHWIVYHKMVTFILYEFHLNTHTHTHTHTHTSMHSYLYRLGFCSFENSLLLVRKINENQESWKRIRFASGDTWLKWKYWCWRKYQSVSAGLS